MQIFVPKYRHNFPHANPDILSSMMVEIQADDVAEVIKYWEKIDSLVKIKIIKEFFATNVKTVCNHPTQKHTLEPFLRRPSLPIHAGSQLGADHCRDAVVEATFRTGYLAQKNGFNLWYGGGNDGLMGQALAGFKQGLLETGRRPDQYSIQVMPAPFVLGLSGKNGMRALNEGLCFDTDAAIIMPDFVTRRELISSRGSGAFTCPGGTGSLDEATDILTHVKTGLRDTEIYFVNTMITKYGRGYWEGIRDFLHQAHDCGLEKARTISLTHFVDTPDEGFMHLMRKLTDANNTPDEVYGRYCQEHQVQHGIPKRHQRKKTPELA